MTKQGMPWRVLHRPETLALSRWLRLEPRQELKRHFNQILGRAILWREEEKEKGMKVELTAPARGACQWAAHEVWPPRSTPIYLCPPSPLSPPPPSWPCTAMPHLKTDVKFVGHVLFFPLMSSANNPVAQEGLRLSAVPHQRRRRRRRRRGVRRAPARLRPPHRRWRAWRPSAGHGGGFKVLRSHRPSSNPVYQKQYSFSIRNSFNNQKIV